MENNECHRSILGFEGFYEIDVSGEIRSLNREIVINCKRRRVRGKVIRPRTGRDGYLSVRLSKEGKTYTKYVHRIMAEAFVKNLQHKPFVNHINGNKQDNRVENLEWVSHSENISHAYRTGLCKIPEARCRKVVDKCTGRHYKSVREAARHLGISYKTCVNYVNGNRKNPTCLEPE